MFKVVDTPTFTHTVTVFSPTDAGHTAETLKVTYELISTDEADRFDTGTREGTTEFLKRIIHRMDDLVSESGSALSYSEALRDRLIAMPHIRLALLTGYFDAVAKDPKSKN